jgi:hypothetical protein
MGTSKNLTATQQTFTHWLFVGNFNTTGRSHITSLELGHKLEISRLQVTESQMATTSPIMLKIFI